MKINPHKKTAIQREYHSLDHIRFFENKAQHPNNARAINPVDILVIVDNATIVAINGINLYTEKLDNNIEIIDNNKISDMV